MAFDSKRFFEMNYEVYADKLSMGDLSVIPSMFCLLVADPPPYKLKAAQALLEALRRLSCDEIYTLDRQMRETTSMEWSIDWRSVKLRALFTWRMNTKKRRAITIFASFNPNGYMRQEAVEKLVGYPNTLPFLILRLNDWVPNVRKAAADAVSVRIKAADKREFIEALPYAEQLKAKSRHQGLETLDTITAKLLSDEDLKKTALKSKNFKTRRFCIQALSDSNADVDRQLLMEHSRLEKEPFLRRLIFEKMISSSPEKVKVCTTFICDKNPTTRVLALQKLYEFNPTISVQYSEKMMFDRNQTARELARYILNQREPEINFRALYIENLHCKTPSSIKGLGEVGSKEDCEIIEKYITSDSDETACAAMAALIRLDAERYNPVITEALASSKASLVKTAALLLKRGGSYNYERVFEIAESPVPEYNKIKCAALLFTASKWESLEYTLSLIGSSFNDLESLCQRQLRSWLFTANRSYLALTPEKAESLLSLMDEKARYIGEETLTRLRFNTKA